MRRLGWTITHDGRTYHECDLTVAQAVLISADTGGSWSDLHPLTSPLHFTAILTSFLVAGGANPDEALAKVGSLPMVDALDMITPGEADAVPH